MTAIVFPINPTPGLEFPAENGVTYRWEEDGTSWGVWRALGMESVEPEPEPEPDPTAELEKPEILAPENGAGIEEPNSYKTSEVVSYGDEKVGGSVVVPGATSGSTGFENVEYGNGIFVAVGQGVGMGSNMAISWSRSSNIETWYNVVNGVGDNNYINGNVVWDVAFGNGKFLVLPQVSTKSSYPMTSTDAVTWTKAGGYPFSPDNITTRSYVWGGSQFVVMPYSKYVNGSTTQTNKYIVSADGSTWTSKTLPVSAQFTCVRYANVGGVHTLIALAPTTTGSSQMIRSVDGGDSFSVVSGQGATYWQDVAYGDGKWIAVGKISGDRVKVSTDNGATWSTTGITGLPSDLKGQAITYGDGVWVLVTNKNASSEQVYYSEDGLKWVETQFDDSNRYPYGITHADGTFVVIGRHASTTQKHAVFSKDGKVWGGTRKVINLTNEKIYDAVDDTELSELTIADVFKKGDRIESSTDSSISAVLEEDANADTYKMFVKDVTGTWTAGLTVFKQDEKTDFGPEAGSLEFVSSIPVVTDGVVEDTDWGVATWTIATKVDMSDSVAVTKDIVPNVEQTLTPDDRLGVVELAQGTQYYTSVHYSSATPAAVSPESDVITFKTDMIPPIKPEGWTAAGNVWNGSFMAIAAGPNFFAAVGNSSGKTAYSATGKAWVDGTAWSGNYFEDIAYANGYFVTVCRGSTSTSSRIMYSDDAVFDLSTTTHTMAPPTRLYGVCYGDGVWVAVGNSSAGSPCVTVSDSDNAPSEWTPNREADMMNGQNMLSVAYGNGTYVAGGSNKVYVTTDPMAVWSEFPAPTGEWSRIEFANGKFVAIDHTSTDKIIVSDTNGESWEAVTGLPAGRKWSGIHYGSGLWAVVSPEGHPKNVYYSSDLENWTESTDIPTLETNDKYKWGSICFSKYVDTWVVGDTSTNGGLYKFCHSTEIVYYDAKNSTVISEKNVIAKYGVDPKGDLTYLGIYQLTEQPTYTVRKYERVGNKYKPIRDYQSELQALTTRIQELEGS